MCQRPAAPPIPLTLAYLSFLNLEPLGVACLEQEAEYYPKAYLTGLGREFHGVKERLVMYLQRYFLTSGTSISGTRYLKGESHSWVKVKYRHIWKSKSRE